MKVLRSKVPFALKIGRINTVVNCKCLILIQGKTVQVRSYFNEKVKFIINEEGDTEVELTIEDLNKLVGMQDKQLELYELTDEERSRLKE